ncbi:hypothetical protein [Gemmatimonas aurantiaca]|uniref:hypothetical protein n=1 Tax=Gemmatimonas aurantiaca TaxID=173480 RepID=UPI00301CC797
MPGTWTWWDAIIFIAVILALKATMFWLLTTIFLRMITEGDRCPVCDGETQAVERSGWWRIFGSASRSRRSWCVECGWEGLLRRSDEWVARERERRRAWSQVNEVRARAQSRSAAGSGPGSRAG